jgi:uncharacterized membrane protein
MDKELRIASFAFVTIFAVLVVLQPFLMNANTQRFSELAILGPNREIGGYPRNIGPSSNISLYGYIENHEGSVQYYQFFVKLGNESTRISSLTPANASIIFEASQIVENNQNYTFPISLSVNTTGTNVRLLFELWAYSVEKEQFEYTGVWAQLWINVTKPPSQS